MNYRLAITFGLFASTVAHGAVIFSLGNTPQVDEPVLFHDSCSGCVDGPGSLVIGHTQTSNLLTDLTTSGQITAVDPGHNSVSTPLDVGFLDMSISIPGYSFTSIILNLTELSTVPNGTVTFTAHVLGGADVVSSALFVDHMGGNYYTITTTGGTKITQLDLQTSELQHDISQIRIGGAEAIPEPSTFWLMGIASAAGVLFVRRRQPLATAPRK